MPVHNKILATVLTAASLMSVGVGSADARTSHVPVTTAVTSSPSMLGYRGKTMDFADEFTGSKGSAPSTTNYDYNVGPGWGSGNGEVQTYTSDRSNSQLDGSGHLNIIARRDSVGNYTSARMVTLGKKDVGYGITEVRVKMPTQKGLNGAIWMMGTDQYTAGWPNCGEIDVAEIVNGGTSGGQTLHASSDTIPWQMGSPSPLGTAASSDYHTYRLLHLPDRIAMSIDGVVQFDKSAKDLTPGQHWDFNKRMSYIFTLAVGNSSSWQGAPDPKQSWPATMSIDYLRHWTV